MKQPLPTGGFLPDADARVFKMAPYVDPRRNQSATRNEIVMRKGNSREYEEFTLYHDVSTKEVWFSLDAGAIKAADAKVRETVESILAQVDERKDAAIRELSEKFDKWSPKDFHLSPSEVERAIAQVPKRDIEDIKFAQAQVRNFAQKQRDTLLDLEVETLPGVVLGHRHIPVNSIGC